MNKENIEQVKIIFYVLIISLFSLTLFINQATAQICKCELETITGLKLPDTKITTVETVTGGTFTPADGSPPITGLPSFCRVALVIAPTSDSHINVEVWMPTSGWNNRLQAVGGGGYAGDISWSAMAEVLKQGYTTVSTDTGHTSEFPGIMAMMDGSFALKPDGTLNWEVIADFASRSIHEMTVKAKAIINASYGKAASYSYFTGCSTGGRQGLMLAQRYPKDYDGILSGCPAINWDRFLPAELWPQVVMQNDLRYVIPYCKLTYALNAAIAACDELDGVVDGVIDDPRRCNYNIQMLQSDSCATTDCDCMTSAEAAAINKIWAGPRDKNGNFLWYGMEPGTVMAGQPFGGLAGEKAFPISTSHFMHWLEQNPHFDWHTLDYAGFAENFNKSVALFKSVIGTDDPDLMEFRGNGGKLLIWHGWADSLIFPKGTINYYEQVLNTMGGPKKVQKFARLFMAPGVDHCGGGTGPNVFNMFEALQDWVERGIAPDEIIAVKHVNNNPAGDIVRSRPLCPYPQVSRYKGSGNIDDASNFVCMMPIPGL